LICLQWIVVIFSSNVSSASLIEYEDQTANLFGGQIQHHLGKDTSKIVGFYAVSIVDVSYSVNGL
jgi:hypothetical protein